MTRSTNNSTASLLEDDSDANRRHKRLLPNLAPAPRPLDPQPAISPPISPTAARRGRKPGNSSAVSRTAREAARKSNHSRIEKLRREKINDALASLRELVPYDQADVAKKSPGDKEFKLEILERTVVYLARLKRRVQQLEASKCSHCGHRQDLPPDDLKISSTDSHMTTRPADLDDDSDLEEDEINPSPIPSPVLPPAKPTDPAVSHPPGYVRLPPISSLIHGERPQYEPISPPNSGRSQPYQPPAAPPTLRLPTAYDSHQQPSYSPTSRNPSKSSDTSRNTSRARNQDVWTPEDESAASMLIQFSTRSSSSPKSSHETSPTSTSFHAASKQPSPRQSHTTVHTPASMLGMSHLINPSEDARSSKRMKLTQ
ncbi:hypothetical protein FRB99_006750 [Tulasnella sp. 403]|nr:hypothetical protein FRB99_006750 [Tulasnella sp. 403]